MYLFNPSPKPRGFEYYAKNIVPVIAAVAVIIAQLQRQETLMWALLAVFVFSLLGVFFPQVIAWAKGRRQSRKDDRIARQQFRALKGFVGRFGEFVAWGQPPSVDGAIANAFGKSFDTLKKFGIPSINLFWGLWNDVNARAARQKPGLVSFETITSELSTLISTYDNFAMQVVFDQFPQELRTALDDRAKSELNACREQFNSFLNEYEALLRGFGDDFLQRHPFVYSFSRVKPL